MILICLIAILIFGGSWVGIISSIIDVYKKTEREKQQKIIRQQNIEKRERFIAGIENPKYDLLKPIVVDASSNYEERSLIEAFNNNVPFINSYLKIEQYNQFAREQQTTLKELNVLLGYESNADFDKLPHIKTNDNLIDTKKVYVSSNFEKMYKYFIKTTEWDEFISYVKNIKLDNNSKLFHNKINSKYDRFFNGYDLNTIKLSKDNYLLFFPCYIIHLNGKALNVITYDDMKFSKKIIEKRCDSISIDHFVRSEYVNGRTYYINKVPQLVIELKNNRISFTCERIDSINKINKHYDSFFKSLKTKENLDFFEKTFAISEEEQIINEKKRITEEREKIFSIKRPHKYQTLKLPKTSDKYSSNEEERINKAFISFLKLKNEKLKVTQQKEFLEKLKQKLIQLNIEMGYPEDKDFEKLPTVCNEDILNEKSLLPNSFTHLYKYFSKKSEWNEFAKKIKETNFITNKHKIDKDILDLYTEFFKGYNSKLIYSFDKNSCLIFFPCYIIYIQKEKPLEVISYEKFKLKLEYKDEKTANPKKLGGKIIAEEYTYQNVDGTPDKRRKINPIIFTVRYFSLCVSWSGHIRLMQSDNSELLFELFNKYTEIFEDAETAFVFKKIFTDKEETDIKNIVSEYKAKLKKQSELAEKKRLEEERAKAFEDEQRKLAIIQKQKERNEEMIRKKELERKALQLFGEDTPEANEENKNVANSDISSKAQYDLPFSVENQCVITNNIFKLELKQEINTIEDEYNIVFVDSNKVPISNKRSVKKATVGEKSIIGITLLSNIDFTIMKKCFMQIEANGKVIGEIPFKMNIAFYSDF